MHATAATRETYANHAQRAVRVDVLSYVQILGFEIGPAVQGHASQFVCVDVAGVLHVDCLCKCLKAS